MKKLIAFFVLVLGLSLATDMPADWVDGNPLYSSDLNAMKATRTGVLKPINPTSNNYEDNTQDLGSDTSRWRNIYLGGTANFYNGVNVVSGNANISGNIKATGNLSLTGGISTDKNETIKFDILSGSYNGYSGTITIAHGKGTNIRGAAWPWFGATPNGINVYEIYFDNLGNINIRWASDGPIYGTAYVVIFYI